MLKLKPSVSNTLRVTSFLAACCVVLIHANTIHVLDSPAPWNLQYHHVLCQTLTCWAVPYFFAASGFFFARSAYIANNDYGAFLQKKFWGLLCPYLLWGVVGAVFGIPLCAVANKLAGRPDFANTIFAESGWRVIDGLLGIVRESPRHNGVLWFVRTLMIMFVFAPIWRVLARKSLGWIFVVLWAFVPANALARVLGMGGGGAAPYFWLGMAVSIYCPSCFLSANHAVSGRGRTDGIILSLARHSFWIYCTHSIILGYILAIGHRLFGKTDCAIALLTPTAAVLAVAVAVFTAKLTTRIAPRLYSLLNGGR